MSIFIPQADVISTNNVTVKPPFGSLGPVVKLKNGRVIKLHIARPRDLEYSQSLLRNTTQATDNDNTSLATIFGSNNTKNTGSNRNIFIERQSSGYIVLDSIGPLINTNMRNGNFNFTSGSIQYSPINPPIIQYSKNIVLDSSKQYSRPVFKYSAPNPINKLSVGIDIYPDFSPDSKNDPVCTTVWVCIQDIL